MQKDLELQEGFIFTINGRLNIVVLDQRQEKVIWEIGQNEMGIYLVEYIRGRQHRHECPEEFEEACFAAFRQEELVANMTHEEREDYHRNHLAA